MTIDSGVKSVADFNEHKENQRRKLVELIACISAASDIVFISFYSLIGFRVLLTPILILVSFIPIYFLIIILNRKGYSNSAKIYIASINSLITFSFSLFFFGSAPGIHIFLLIFGIIPFFIWSKTQIGYLTSFFLINLIGFIYIEFFTLKVSFNGIYPAEYASFTRSFCILTSFLATTVAVIGFHWLSYNNEILQVKQHTQIEEQKNILEKLNYQLKIKIQELIKNQEELSRANIVKGKIYSIIAHDLRSPFSSINRALEHLTEEYGSYDIQHLHKLIDNAYKTSNTAFALLENLLDWAQIQTNRIKISPKILNVYDVAEDAIAHNRSALKGKQITIKNSISEHEKVFSDKYMLSTILRNLISNAIKFTHDGGTIQLLSNMNGKNMVEIHVIDSGIGMPQHEIDKLFQIENTFVRTGTNNEKGTGLGLLICKEFVEYNGGTIKVSSEPEKGSKFTITLNATAEK